MGRRLTPDDGDSADVLCCYCIVFYRIGMHCRYRYMRRDSAIATINVDLDIVVHCDNSAIIMKTNAGLASKGCSIYFMILLLINSDNN